MRGQVLQEQASGGSTCMEEKQLRVLWLRVAGYVALLTRYPKHETCNQFSFFSFVALRPMVSHGLL
jgi:hypothetical protein